MDKAPLDPRRNAFREDLADARLQGQVAATRFVEARPGQVRVAIAPVFGTPDAGTALTTSFTAAGSVVPRHAHGVGFGFLTGAALIGSAISPALSGLLAVRSINAVFLSGAAVLALLVLLVRRLMVERNLPFESAPAVDET